MDYLQIRFVWTVIQQMASYGGPMLLFSPRILACHEFYSNGTFKILTSGTSQKTALFVHTTKKQHESNEHFEMLCTWKCGIGQKSDVYLCVYLCIFIATWLIAKTMRLETGGKHLSLNRIDECAGILNVKLFPKIFTKSTHDVCTGWINRLSLIVALMFICKIVTSLTSTQI